MMAIPVISEIFSFIQSFFQIIPKSLKYVFFLFILVVVLSIIPFLLHMTGIHCNSSKLVVKTNTFDFTGNYEVARLNMQDVYNTTEYAAETSLGDSNSCALLLKLIEADSGFWGVDYYSLCTANDISTNNTNCSYALKVLNRGTWTSSIKPRCVLCDDYREVSFVGGSFDNGYYCFSEAFSNNASSCPDFEKCDVPIGYKYANTTGRFVCIDNNICGTNATNRVYAIDVKLNSMNSQPFYTSTPSNNYEGALRIECDNQLTPQITIYNIQIFDYKLWIVMMVLGALFFFLSKIKRH